MPTIELDPGERHTLAVAPLILELTGAEVPGARLTALDQAGAENVTQRISAKELLLTPEPRRVRVVVQSGGAPFPPQTRLGLAVRTYGGTVVAEQVLISPLDVGALAEHEFAVIEFATDRVICSATAIAHPVRDTPVADLARVAPVHAPPPPVPYGSAPVAPIAPVARPAPPPPYGNAPVAPAQPAATPVAEPLPRVAPAATSADSSWMEAGRYAFRNGRNIAAPESAPRSWAVVLDGSASMERVHEGGQLGTLIALVCGIHLEWTGVSGAGAVVGGVSPFVVSNGENDPEGLARAAFGGTELSSWSSVGDAAERISGQIGAEGSVAIVTDGVPGDVDRLVRAAQNQPGTRFHILTLGRSVHGLAPDGVPEWWEEELAGLHACAALPNVRVAALRCDASGRPVLDEARAAHLAARFSGPHPQAVLP